MSIEKIQARFASGNSVPVDKAVVPSSEWNAAMSEIAALRAALERPVQEPVAVDVVCEECGGNGFDRKDANYQCANCNGSGSVEKTFYTTPPDTDALLREAWAYMRWHCWGECRTPGFSGMPRGGEELDAAISKHLGEAA